MKYQAFFVISPRFCPVISTLHHQDLVLFGTSISNILSPNTKLLRPTPTQKGKMSGPALAGGGGGGGRGTPFNLCPLLLNHA